MTIGIVLAVLGAIVGEFVGAKAGLGYQIVEMNFIDGVFAILFVLAVIGITFDVIMTQIRRRLLFGHKELRGHIRKEDREDSA